MIGLEAVGMSLEDIFISVVDQTEREKATSSHRYERSAKKRTQRIRNALENDIAESMVKDAEAKREADAAEEIED